VRRSSGENPSQPPISARVRPQPMQNPVSGSTTQIFTQGVSMAGWFMAFMPVKIVIHRAAASAGNAARSRKNG
jgi:hypothetical protein